MSIKTIPLSELEANPKKALSECADKNETMLVELPDHRMLAIQPLDPNDDDDLVNRLLQTNSAFRALIEKAKAGPRKPFAISD
jgi:hypothetical protein